MKKRLFAILFLLVTSFCAQGQNPLQIKRDTSYVFGEGTGKTIKKADSDAIGEIVKKCPELAAFQSALAQASQRIVTNKESSAQVMRYIKKSEIHDIFLSRKDKIIEMLSFAESAESKVQIGDALRYLYWLLR